jgi:hypothetical protein
MYVTHQMCFFLFVSHNNITILFFKAFWNEKKTHIKRGHCVFFPFNFCLWMWHATKSIRVWCHNMVPNYVTYDVYIIYTTILDFDYWIKINVVANWSGCKSFTSQSFVYILTIELGWNNLKCLHKIEIWFFFFFYNFSFHIFVLSTRSYEIILMTIIHQI